MIKGIKHLTLLLLFVFIHTSIDAQVTFTKDIAPIIFKHCTTCHRPGEIGPFALTNYTEVSNWANTIKSVTASKYMPPWKADPSYSRFLDENFLSDDEIKVIADWVDSGVAEGNANDLPPLPIFPEGSLLGKPDLVLSFAKSYKHKGNGSDEYRYFVLPTGLTKNRKLKAIEMRAGNKKIVHHALFFSDVTGKARDYDNRTPEYGFSSDEFSDFGTFEVLNQKQFPGYVPGQKSRKFPDGLAQEMTAGSDLVMQVHYAPWSTDQLDSSSVNIFFADENEVIDRTVRDYIMLPFNLVKGQNDFFILPNQIKKFEGVYTVPFDISLVGIFPHMHLLGRDWEVYIKHPDGTKTNLIKIPDWDFNWQGGYYFERYKIAKKGSKIHAFATYDNTKDNPFNPNNPPRFTTWGEGTKDEMYYLPLLFVPYNTGDENIIFSPITSVKDEFGSNHNIKGASIFPNPALSNSQLPTNITFSIAQAGPINIELLRANGEHVRRLKDNEFYQTGSHLVHLQQNHLAPGLYFIKISGLNDLKTIPYIVH